MAELNILNLLLLFNTQLGLLFFMYVAYTKDSKRKVSKKFM